MMKKLLLLMLAFASVGQGFAGVNALGVMKYAKGDIRATVEGVETSLKGSELVVTGEKINAGLDGKAVMRLLPDHAFLEIRPKTTFTIRRIKSKDKRIRKVMLDAGEVVLGLKKKSEPIQCESMHTQALAQKGRFACKTDEQGVATILVQDGEVSVYNRPKDLSITVRSGQKAISDIDGIKVSDATDSELEQVGFRQNTIEVDFVNPETEEFTTLEVEYETNF
jgi:hypothetical protein